MSIDKLILELDKPKRDFQKLRECSRQSLTDYLGVAEAYLSLLEAVREKPEKVNFLCEIIREIINNIQTLNQLIRNAEQLSGDEMDMHAGQILKGEQVIDIMIEKFETISDSE